MEGEKTRSGKALRLAVDAGTHEVICADLSLNNVTDAEAFPGLIHQTHRKSGSLQPTELMTPDGATTSCGVRKSKDLSRREPEWVTGWLNVPKEIRRLPGNGSREAMRTGNGIRLTTDVRWLKRQCTVSNSCLVGILRCGIMMRALNKMTRAGMPESVRIA